MIKNIKLTALVLLAVITFTACGTIQAMRPVNLSSLKLGMSKEEVQTQLRKKPDNIIATKKDPDTNALIEVVQYSESNGEANIPTYWLYFVNGKLDRWEKADKNHGPWI